MNTTIKRMQVSNTYFSPQTDDQSYQRASYCQTLSKLGGSIRASHLADPGSNPSISKVFSLMLLRLVDGGAQNSGQWLNNVDRTHLVLASGNQYFKKHFPNLLFNYYVSFNFTSYCRLALCQQETCQPHFVTNLATMNKSGEAEIRANTPNTKSHLNAPWLVNSCIILSSVN